VKFRIEIEREIDGWRIAEIAKSVALARGAVAKAKAPFTFEAGNEAA
jgi:hypothetical protein